MVYRIKNQTALFCNSAVLIFFLFKSAKVPVPSYSGIRSVSLQPEVLLPLPDCRRWSRLQVRFYLLWQHSYIMPRLPSQQRVHRVWKGYRSDCFQNKRRLMKTADRIQHCRSDSLHFPLLWTTGHNCSTARRSPGTRNC